MPTYEYQCTKCRRTFEFYQAMKDDAVKTCPKDACPLKTWGRGKVQRLIGAGAGLIFKGSGDQRSESYKAAARKDARDIHFGGAPKKAEPKPPAKKLKLKFPD